MIISRGFITNSSSTCYLLIFRGTSSYDKAKKVFEPMLRRKFGIRYFEIFNNKQELTEYTQGKKCDWVSLAMGPDEYLQLSRDEYTTILSIMEEIKKPKIVGYIDVRWGKTHDEVLKYCKDNHIKITYLAEA